MRDEEKYEQYARKVRIFNSLRPDDVAEILHHGKVIHFQRGQTIFHEGMLGSNLFVVLSGQIGIYNRGKLIARCHVGDAFGEMAVLNRKPRCATAAALSDATLFTLEEAQINDLLEKHIAVRVLLNVIHVLSERLEAANMWISENREKAGSRQ
jgi:CRP-like cAMP-binding protein